MAKAKENFGKIMEHQQSLVEKMTANTGKVMEMLGPKEAYTKEGQELWEDFIKRSRTMMEEQLHPENLEKFWVKMPETYSRTMEMQMDFFNRSTELMRRSLEKYAVPTQPDYWKKVSEIYMDNYTAMMEASNAQIKAMQEYLAN